MDTKNYFVHESSYVDEPCQIGKGTKIWHFSHVMKNSVIGENCNIGQNVVVSPDVQLGNNVKIQNNVSVYTGVVCEDDVFLGPSMVFTNVINPRSGVIRKEEYMKTVVKKGALLVLMQRSYVVTILEICIYWGWSSSHKRSSRLCINGRQSVKKYWMDE